MKKYKLVLLAIIASLSFNSCYDLDLHPYDQVEEEAFWKNEAQVKQGMMGVYNSLKDEKAFGLKFSNDCMSDIGAGYDAPGFGYVINGGYNDRTQQVEEKWKSLYDGVQRANNVLRKLPLATNLTEEQKNIFTGEARFLRALFYFELYNFFGEIPLYDETVDLAKDYNNMKKPRSSVEDVIKFILDDLAYSINSLPVKWDKVNYGRATKGAAYALRGKVYLYKKEYIKAAADFEEIISNKSNDYGYTLYPSYADLFTPEGDESDEMIFAIQNSGGVGMDYGMPMAFYMGNRSTFSGNWNNAMPSSTVVDMYECKDGKPFNWNDYIPGFNENQTVRDETFFSILSSDGKKVDQYPKNKELLLAMYEQRDPRMKETILLPYTTIVGWVNNAPKTCEFVVAKNAAPNENNGFIRANANFGENYLYRKFVPEGNMNGAINNRAHTPINFPLIRLADVYLMYAECKNELGDQVTAVNYINKVRQRLSVSLPELNSGPEWLVASTKENVFKRIMQERAVELIGEGHRYHDLRRWGLAKNLIPRDVKGFTGKVYYNYKFTDRDMLWPIPGVEIERNPNLKPNNPGWD